VSDARPPGHLPPGSGTPLTWSGRSVGYRPPPWAMRGRAIAIWYRLARPDEVLRHLPRSVQVDADPVIRARFWDLRHDAGPPSRDEERPDGSSWTPIREAVVAIPVRHGSVQGDLPQYMYADDPVYIAMGREVMGWPVRGGRIEIDGPADDAPVDVGTAIVARLIRGGTTVMSASLTITGDVRREEGPIPPRWITEKVIPRADAPGVAVAQLLATGPERIARRDIRPATASLAFSETPGDELAALAPREVVRAEYWSGLDLSIGWGEVLETLGDEVYERG